jgi:hypothetical protein
MYTPREAASRAVEYIQRVAEKRVEVLERSGSHALWAEAFGTHPGIRLEVQNQNGTRWVEYIESACTRGAHAFDMEYLDALMENGWLVLHYPDSLINEEVGRLKAEELLALAMGSGMDRAEVWVYLYDTDGNETRIT